MYTPLPSAVGFFFFLSAGARRLPAAQGAADRRRGADGTLPGGHKPGVRPRRRQAGHSRELFEGWVTLPLPRLPLLLQTVVWTLLGASGQAVLSLSLSLPLSA